jgi:hypothetical protein
MDNCAESSGRVWMLTPMDFTIAFVVVSTIVLSRKAGEEGAPTQLGKVRGQGLRSCFSERCPSSPRCGTQRVPSYPAEEAGED